MESSEPADDKLDENSNYTPAASDPDKETDLSRVSVRSTHSGVTVTFGLSPSSSARDKFKAKNRIAKCPRKYKILRENYNFNSYLAKHKHIHPGQGE